MIGNPRPARIPGQGKRMLPLGLENPPKAGPHKSDPFVFSCKSRGPWGLVSSRISEKAILESQDLS